MFNSTTTSVTTPSANCATGAFKVLAKYQTLAGLRGGRRLLFRSFFLIILLHLLCLSIAAQWATQTSGTANNLFGVHFINASEGWAVGATGTILHTTDGGANWSPQTSGTTENLLGVRAIDASFVWAAGARALARTTDGGVNWGTAVNPSPTFFINTIFPVSSTVAWSPSLFTGSERHFSRFRVTGPSTIVEDVFDSVPSVSPFQDIFFTDADNGWATGFGQIRRITNASTSPSFAFQTSGTAQTLNGIHMGDSNNGWIVGNNGTILHTTNGGTTWAPQTSGVPATSFFDVFFDVDLMHGWAVGNSGTIIATINGGNSWFTENSGVAVQLRGVFGSGGVVYAVGAGGTILKRTGPTAANGVITGRIVDDNGNPVAGAVVRLNGTQNRKFITDANGVYRFENVETTGFYNVTPSRANYTFSPAEHSFSQIGEITQATFGATAAGSGFVNPLDTPEYFVRQHYLDFLGREPDEAGFNFWSDQILECGSEQSCIDRRRENVSAAYFLSIEFQQTGGLVDVMYRASFGTAPQYGDFMPDTRTIGQGLVVGRDGWEARLRANKEVFAFAFVNRAAFRQMYDGMNNSQFVDTLISHTGVTFNSSERDALVSGLNNQTMTRGDALRSIAENQAFVNAKFNEAFVMMEYFGYLRRDPDADGYAFWLRKLNQFNGNFEQAEMVKAFIVSGEFRGRFPR